MKTYTKKQALELCREQWQMIVDNPRLYKFVAYDLVHKKYDLIGYQEANCNCFCCDYTFKLDEVNCDRCPLKKLWPNGCLQSPSVYNTYCLTKYDEDPTQCQNAAKEIVQGCDAALKELEEKENKV